MPESNPLAALRAAAEAARQQLQANRFDAAGVQRLADYLEGHRAAIKPADREGAVLALGCFLGQCVVETYGGQWAAGPDGSTGVGVGGNRFYNPFYRVAQQLDYGSAWSVVDFFVELAVRPANPAGQR